MYQQHQEFQEPTTDIIIWRYLDFAMFIFYLEKKHCFLFEATSYLINMMRNLLREMQIYG
ncbi:hypothetical protein AYK25_06025 [Thermoplasmatales archaeon SM1-50]|nr:MAG: hypothetical protein AYK25_06025 [Thermoplasmatales archaeon SM1-50]